MSKEIFRYNNGEADLFADPIATERKIRMSLGGDPAAVLAALWNTEASEMEFMLATEKQIDATRKAFGFQPFDPHTGKGTTDDVVLELWDTFWNWLGEKKNTPVTSPMQARFTAPSKISPNSLASRGTMKPTSASG